MALILPVSHPFSSLKYIQKEDLYRLRFIALNTQSTIRNVIESTLTQNGIDSSYFKIEMELNSIEAIKNAVHSHKCSRPRATWGLFINNVGRTASQKIECSYFILNEIDN